MTESTDKPLLDKASADEQQLDEYLKGDSSVSRQYRQLHSVHVPAELDRLVLRQAEDAVKTRPVQGRPAWMRWTAPLAVAASAVLVLSIVIETGLRDDTVSEVAGAHVPQPTIQAEQRERTENKAEEATATEQPAPLSGPEEIVSPTFAPAPPPPPQEQKDARSREPVMNFEAPAEAPRAAAQIRPTAPPVAAPAPAPAPAPEGVTAGESLARSADIAARELQSMPMQPTTVQEQSAAVADDAAREEEITVTTAYSRRINAPMPAPSMAPVHADPEEWLKAIRQLRTENKQEEADREWHRFRAAFPDYEVAETDLAREAKK